MSVIKAPWSRHVPALHCLLPLLTVAEPAQMIVLPRGAAPSEASPVPGIQADYTLTKTLLASSLQHLGSSVESMS